MKKLLVMASAALLVAACGDAKEGFDDGFNRNFRDSFIKSCVGSAGGVEQALAMKLCTCAADKVDQQYSVKEKMSLKSEQLMPIVEQCKAENPA